MDFSFEGEGVLKEKRELKKKDGSSIWRRLFKVAYIGGMIECVVDEKQFPSHNEGDSVKVVGTFEPGFDGTAMLVARSIVTTKPARKAA